MPEYDVYVFCDECGQAHFASVRMKRDDLPFDKLSIADLYAGQDVPPNLNMQNNRYQCPNTGKMFTQRDNNQIFLVAVAE
jgi:hypothetical protein